MDRINTNASSAGANTPGEPKHDHAAGHAMPGSQGHSDMVSAFRRRFWVCLILTVPVVLLSPMIQRVLSIGGIAFPGDQVVQFGFPSPVFSCGGWPFLSGLFSDLSRRRPGMMTLIGLATSVAYFYSTAVVFGVP